MAERGFPQLNRTLVISRPRPRRRRCFANIPSYRQRCQPYGPFPVLLWYAGHDWWSRVCHHLSFGVRLGGAAAHCRRPFSGGARWRYFHPSWLVVQSNFV